MIEIAFVIAYPFIAIIVAILATARSVIQSRNTDHWRSESPDSFTHGIFGLLVGINWPAVLILILCGLFLFCIVGAIKEAGTLVANEME